MIRMFAKGFDGEKVRFKTMVLQFTEDSIAKVTSLLTDDKKWFKRTALKPSDFNHLLVSDHQDPDWRKGIPHIWVKQEFRDLIYLIQKYISCEGRFSLVFLYHLQLLAHLVKDDRLSLPFNFLKSLTKMASKYKGLGETTDTYLFHQGLIKVLIMHELQRVGRSWHQFLCLEGFEASTSEHETSAMPRRAPSSRKGKEKVRNRALRSSASLDSKDKGQDAPLEPICDFFSDPSLLQAKERNPGMAVEQKESEAAQDSEPFTAGPNKSSKSKKGVAQHSGKKHKP